MIERNLPKHNEAFERFFKHFRQKCDYLKKDGRAVYLTEIEVSLIVDAINLWEQLKQSDPYFLTMTQRALLYPELHVFTNSMPNAEN